MYRTDFTRRDTSNSAYKSMNFRHDMNLFPFRWSLLHVLVFLDWIGADSVPVRQHGWPNSSPKTAVRNVFLTKPNSTDLPVVLYWNLKQQNQISASAVPWQNPFTVRIYSWNVALLNCACDSLHRKAQPLPHVSYCSIAPIRKKLLLATTFSRSH